MCMRVRWAICLANTCRHVIISDTYDALVSFFDGFRGPWRGDCDNIDPHSCSGNKGVKKVLLSEQKWIDGDVHACLVGDIFSKHRST